MIHIILVGQDGQQVPTTASHLLCTQCDASPHWSTVWPCPGILFAGARYLPTPDRPPIPAEARGDAFRRAEYRCEDCDVADQPLDAHHLNYLHVGWETANDLAILCRACHDKRHHDPNGAYWRDPTEMADAWSR